MKQPERQIDFTLLFILFCLFLISIVAVYSGSGQYQTDDPFYYMKRQIIWYIIGVAVMIGVATFDYELLERLSAPFYLSGVFLLVLVHFFGTFKNGSQRWLNLGVIELQPSEFMKVFLTIFLAAILNKYGVQRLSFKQSIPITFKLIMFTIIPFALILVQPDLGSALVIGAVFFTLLIVSGISMKMISLFSASAISLISFLVYLHNHYFEVFSKIIKPHQLDRIYGWLMADEFASSYGYQLTQALLGIGSGQLLGKGIQQGQQVQSGRIPEVHTDFIFSVIGEEFGFIGASLLIILYFLLMYRIVKIAQNSNSVYGMYICIGTVGLLSFQIFQNIAMTIGLMPITGLALPFVSYGGSALLTNMMALGLVLSVNIRTKKYMFD
ncbi:rod shape-determining protein RodA [Bacillus sp. PS06]|uniref:rod shape-determining protein RodA n=1 Tax=Bacillus sp. PS06 TaxID=2764176 RepID=UPI00177D0F1B|nr:rod shape-determining protein RodA [Bacillus sp. PS06]MBD8070135.1 rod shape-determining protein RodA [Bacillus sp. PS06]